LHFTDNEALKIEQFLSQYNLENKNIIAIHTGGIGGHKKWGIEKWIELLKNLSELGDYHFIFVSGLDEKENADRIIKELNSNATNLCGKTDPRELCLLLKKCNLLISTDSGPKHIAFLADIPTITIYAAVSERWGAYWDKDKHRIVEIKNIDLTYEESLGLPSNHIINLISPKMVLEEFYYLRNNKYIK
jgi:ADP-heptose:LPS heptosyltransferase